MNKQKKQIISLLTITTLVLNQIFFPLSVFAEEASAEQTQEMVSPVPSEPTSTPPASESTIQTGDAGANAQTQTDINDNQPSPVPGQIVSDGCDVNGTILCDQNIKNDSTTDNTTGSDSQTGTNTINGADEAVIDTGDAAAQSNTSNLINTNIIEAQSTDSGEITDTLSLDDPDHTGYIGIENDADHKADTNSNSSTGQNGITNAQDGLINTGDSIASANQVNIVNTNIIGSNFDVFLMDLLTDQNGDIDLNILWKLLETQTQSTDTQMLQDQHNLDINLDNDVTADVEAHATAVSGQNSIQAENDAEITTGNAYAAANIFNLFNLNIIGSNFMVGIINIFANFKGNIILPNPQKFAEYFAPHFSDEGNTEMDIDNTVMVDQTTVAAHSDSGTNGQIGQDTEMVTGDAIAAGNNVTYANMNLFLSNWYFVLLNNFGLWNGNVVSWNSPSSSAAQGEHTAQYSNVEAQGESENLGMDQPHQGNTDLDINNNAYLTANVTADAISGQNHTQSFSSLIETGRAVALANLFNFMNTNIIGSRIIFPVINLFGSWTGDLIFAYPDLDVTITADKTDVVVGDTVNYNVHYFNKGYDDATDGSLNIQIPEQEMFVSASDGSPSVSGTTLTFAIGNVAAKTGGDIQFTTQVQEPTSRAKHLSLLSQLVRLIVPEAHAESNAQELATTATIASNDSETDNNNNTQTVIKYLITEGVVDETSETTGNAKASFGDPDLWVSSYNNVADHINPGDKVTFTVKTFNDGSGTAHDTFIHQEIFDEYGHLILKHNIKIGDLHPGLRNKLTFTIATPVKSPSGEYTSIITAQAGTDYGDSQVSNESETYFYISGSRKLSLVKPAFAEENSSGKVKGAMTAQVCKAEKDYMPYVLAGILTMLWFVEMRKRRRLEKELSEFMKKGADKS